MFELNFRVLPECSYIHLISTKKNDSFCIPDESVGNKTDISGNYLKFKIKTLFIGREAAAPRNEIINLKKALSQKCPS